MADASGLTGLTQMDVSMALFEELLMRYQQKGAVAVRLVTFAQVAGAQTASWTQPAQALAIVDGFSASGRTNFDVALTQAQTAFAAAGKIGGASNESVFISNGTPNEPVGSVGIKP